MDSHSDNVLDRLLAVVELGEDLLIRKGSHVAVRPSVLSSEGSQLSRKERDPAVQRESDRQRNWVEENRKNWSELPLFYFFFLSAR